MYRSHIYKKSLQDKSRRFRQASKAPSEEEEFRQQATKAVGSRKYGAQNDRVSNV